MKYPFEVRPRHEVGNYPISELARLLVALANTNGGLVCGVDSVHLDAARHLTQPTVAVYGVEKDAFYVPRSNVVHADHEESVYVSQTTTIKRLNGRGIQRLAVLKQIGDFESEVVHGASYQDLDMENIVSFLGDDVDLSLLHLVGVITDAKGTPTVGGLLLFGLRPQMWLPQSTIHIVQYPATDETVRRNKHIDSVRHEIDEGTLPTLLGEAHCLLARLLHVDEQDPTDRSFIVAVREAVSNAVIHREYRMQDPISIEIYTDGVQVTSPGGLLGVDDLHELESSYFARNLHLMRALAHAGFGSQLGQGIGQLQNSLWRGGFPSAHFESTPHDFRVFISRQSPDLEATKPSRLPSTSRRQTDILHYIRDHGSMTERELRALMPRIARQKLQADLQRLLSQKYLTKMVMGHTVCYVLAPHMTEDHSE